LEEGHVELPDGERGDAVREDRHEAVRREDGERRDAERAVQEAVERTPPGAGVNAGLERVGRRELRCLDC
jgi:hypothetical protein